MQIGANLEVAGGNERRERGGRRGGRGGRGRGRGGGKYFQYDERDFPELE